MLSPGKLQAPLAEHVRSLPACSGCAVSKGVRASVTALGQDTSPPSQRCGYPPAFCQPLLWKLRDSSRSCGFTGEDPGKQVPHRSSLSSLCNFYWTPLKSSASLGYGPSKKPLTHWFSPFVFFPILWHHYVRDITELLTVEEVVLSQGVLLRKKNKRVFSVAPSKCSQVSLL